MEILDSLKIGSSAAREVAWQYFKHSSGKRTNTTAVLAMALKRQYPSLHLSIVPVRSANILAYAYSGQACLIEVEDDTGEGGAPASLWHKLFVPPRKRDIGDVGHVLRAPTFGKFICRHHDHDLIVYLSRTQDGTAGIEDMYYILAVEDAWANALIHAAGAWQNQLHKEMSIFEGGAWRRDAALYMSITRASWSPIILDEPMKTALMDDHVAFFQSGRRYQDLGVPWKRGVILHGPPGNGKTISIKAMVKMLYEFAPGVPTLFVRSLASSAGPELSIKRIFDYARQEAPCCLVFEDLDSLDSEKVRSCFLNEADGLESDSGIFMIGVTNHLDRLDPAIAVGITSFLPSTSLTTNEYENRPSRFDRKYHFPNPDPDQRRVYCEFWQSKLAGNRSIEFPVQLCDAIAKITEGFSFAYMQEAFLAALLAIMWNPARAQNLDDNSDDEEYGMDQLNVAGGWVGVREEPVSPDDVDLEQLKLWVEIKKQIQILDKGIKGDPEK